MFLPNLPNSTLNLFLETADVGELPGTNSLMSSFCNSDRGYGSEKANTGEGGLGPGDVGLKLFKLSNPVSKLLVRPWELSCGAFDKLAV